LAAVDDDPLEPAVTVQRLVQKPFSSDAVAPLAEPKFDGVTIAVNGSIEIFPLASQFDVSLIHVPVLADVSFTKADALEQFRQVADSPLGSGRMIDGDAALGHHLLKVPRPRLYAKYHRTQSRTTERSKCLPLNTAFSTTVTEISVAKTLE
jgi:hypothetical protein